MAFCPSKRDEDTKSFFCAQSVERSEYAAIAPLHFCMLLIGNILLTLHTLPHPVLKDVIWNTLKVSFRLLERPSFAPSSLFKLWQNNYFAECFPRIKEEEQKDESLQNRAGSVCACMYRLLWKAIKIWGPSRYSPTHSFVTFCYPPLLHANGLWCHFFQHRREIFSAKGTKEAAGLYTHRWGASAGHQREGRQQSLD